MNFIIYGDVNVGKTTLVEKTVKRLRDDNIGCSGFYTKSDPSSRLLLVSAGSNSRKVLAAPKNEFSSSVRVGRYWFNSDAIDFGIDLTDDEGKFLVVDELGKLKGRKRGFFRFLKGLGKEIIWDSSSLFVRDLWISFGANLPKT